VVAILLGIGIGAGLWLLLAGLRPPTPSAASVLARLSAPMPVVEPATPTQESVGSWSARAGRRFVPLLVRLGLPTAKTRHDLAILGHSAEDLLAQQAASGAAGLILVPC